ncbi:MAG: Uma2 family endonuclease [Tepidisphaerales bacterium]
MKSSAAKATRACTLQHYFDQEIESVDRHEFREGQIVAMAGGSPNHSLIVANVIRELGLRLKGKPCRVYDCNLRIHVPKTVFYTYTPRVETYFRKNDGTWVFSAASGLNDASRLRSLSIDLPLAEVYAGT